MEQISTFQKKVFQKLSQLLNTELNPSIARHELVLKDLSALKALLNPFEEQLNLKGKKNYPTLTPWNGAYEDRHPLDFSQAEDEQLTQALMAVLSGNGQQVKSYEGALQARFFPMPFTLIQKNEINIKKGEKYFLPEKIQHNLVIAVIDTINLEEGGQLIVNAPLTIKVKQFNKTKPN